VMIDEREEDRVLFKSLDRLDSTSKRIGQERRHPKEDRISFQNNRNNPTRRSKRSKRRRRRSEQLIHPVSTDRREEQRESELAIDESTLGSQGRRHVTGIIILPQRVVLCLDDPPLQLTTVLYTIHIHEA
jgi:hypothetical protein